MSESILPFDEAYNSTIPDNWWSGSWRPTKMCYGAGSYGEGGVTSSNNNLTINFQSNNAYCYLLYFLNEGWTFEAICGLFGNIQSEGLFSPGKWENGHNFQTGYGFGITQWTPATKYISWAAAEWPDDPWGQYHYCGWYEAYRLALECLNVERQWYATETYNFSMLRWAQGYFSDLSTISERLEGYTRAFFSCYERGTWSSQRITRARAWYDRFAPLFPSQAQTLTSTVNRTPAKPDSYFNIWDLPGGGGGPPGPGASGKAWLYKVLYMASKRGGGYNRYGR